jgi:hypothetical protein
MLETLIGILGTGFLGMIGWVIQLGSRVSVAETRHEDLLELINTRFDEVSRRLDRIERAMNGALKGHD